MIFLDCLPIPQRHRTFARALPAMLLALGTACSDDKSNGPATGGGSTSGGAGTTGSSGAPAAGTPATGGRNPGAGGVSSAGGPAAGGPTAGAPSGGSAPTAGGGGAGGAGVAGGGTGAASGSPGTAGTSGNGGTAGAGMGVQGVVSSGVRWVGRVDVANSAGERFAWSGTGFVGNVSGDTISVKLRSEGGNDPIYFQAVIGGEPKMRFSVASAEGEKTVVLGTGLGAGPHRVELYRETEGKPGFATSTFVGFASGEPQAPPPYNGRLLEVVGDSISAGYGNLGMEQHPNGSEDPNGGCRFTTETESAYKTYGAIAARALEADASIVAASGWGVYSDNGGSRTNVLKTVYGSTLPNAPMTAWTFGAIPQAVVINLGTNDFSADDALAEEPFSAAYLDLLTTIRGKYPNALILCAIGPLLYGTGLTNAKAYINAVVNDVRAAGDMKVKVLDFGQQDASKGTGCDWHPNVAENQRMADMLVKELRASSVW